ncbi:Transposase [Vibrio xiamenensis]|uniref:Transposase n=1 Tax=Vibrio xiamenensis TaxID=861298 RepID=A0A1G8CJA2_9VIBR|nr:Transposase [Vibrio xiamenensis]
MIKRTRRTFSAEFRLEAAQLVLDQNYTVVEAAKAMGVGKSTMDKWVSRPELREHFGSGNTSSERQTPHPVLRVVTMMNVRSHVIVDAAISPYRRGVVA